jgi:hypothetical protein
MPTKEVCCEFCDTWTTRKGFSWIEVKEHQDYQDYSIPHSLCDYACLSLWLENGRRPGVKIGNKVFLTKDV